eukprot:scaffold45747_cov61-Phaeocystis_antarctica.AAC.1
MHTNGAGCATRLCKPQCTPWGLERSGRYGWVQTLSPPLGVLTRGKLDAWYHIPSPRTPTEAV